MDNAPLATRVLEQETPPAGKLAKKPRSVRHTRAIQRDRSKRPPQPPPDGAVAARLTEVIHPLTLGRAAHHRQGQQPVPQPQPRVGALVLRMIWRQVGSVSTLVLLLEWQGFLRTGPVRVSQQALSPRLRVFPAALFRAPRGRMRDPATVRMITQGPSGGQCGAGP